ncbi:MAG: pyridoxal-phosphate dependent enzyme [Microscillaceae bacterium]|nr:pyridoxal-phosphate dependent enzyme [Microscillaceae bacterium]
MNFICRATQETYPLDVPRWRSESGNLLDIQFLPRLDWEMTTLRPYDLWRYREVMPLSDMARPVSFGEGFTPLQKMSFGPKTAWVKLDFLFPSGSYKDRGSTLMMSYLRDRGVTEVVQDSSGNAGASVAQYAARAGIKCRIFLPAGTSPAKIAQMQFCGAEIVEIDGSREDTARAAREAAETTFYASHVWHPLFFHGTKTFAYELYEQFNFKAPDTIVLPAGNGTLLLGVYIGFWELFHTGAIPKMPKLIGVQAAACAPLYQAFQNGETTVPALNPEPTLAEGIAIAQPLRGPQMLEYVRETGGRFLAIEEAEIIQMWHHLASQGYFVEPTSAAVIAGLQFYLAHEAQSDERVVSVLSGHGLKSVEKMKRPLAG